MLQNEKKGNLFFHILSNDEKTALKEVCTQYILNSPAENFFKKLINEILDCQCIPQIHTTVKVSESYINFLELVINRNSSLSFDQESNCEILVDALYNEIPLDISKVENKCYGTIIQLYLDKYVTEWIPKMIMLIVLVYYTKNNIQKKNIIGRIPFILEDQYRLLLIKLKFLNQCSNNDSDLFIRKISSVLIKSPSKEIFLDEETKKEIIDDLFKLDFEVFPASYFFDTKQEKVKIY